MAHQGCWQSPRRATCSWVYFSSAAPTAAKRGVDQAQRQSVLSGHSGAGRCLGKVLGSGCQTNAAYRYCVGAVLMSCIMRCTLALLTDECVESAAPLDADRLLSRIERMLVVVWGRLPLCAPSAGSLAKLLHMSVRQPAAGQGRCRRRHGCAFEKRKGGRRQWRTSERDERRSSDGSRRTAGADARRFTGRRCWGAVARCNLFEACMAHHCQRCRSRAERFVALIAMHEHVSILICHRHKRACRVTGRHNRAAGL